MENIFNINVNEETFEKIVNQTKTTHLEVNVNKYKALSVGNQITFSCVEGENKKQCGAVIENLLYFSTIVEAVETLGKEKCGFRPSATFEKTSDDFLSTESYEDIEKFGIIAIVFKIM